MRLAVVSLVVATSCARGVPREEPVHNIAPPRSPRSKPAFDEVNSAVRALSDAVPYLSENPDTATALNYLGSPLWIDGMQFTGHSDNKLATDCMRLPGTLVSPEQLHRFAVCSQIADWRHSGLAGEEGIGEVSVARIPSVFAKHRARLLELSRDHTFVYGHFCPAAPGDFWTLIAATKERGHVVIDAILVFNESDGDCREEQEPP